ncbi:conserved oligomeric Golgi complex component [Chytriomyces hyalinus]|nr:conserved oligomeric Golgi complex component [Chytriomyces hyalinus]
MQQQLNSLLMEMGLSQLRQLPVQLAEEQREIDHSLAALASKEHRAFLQANACARNVETAAANAALMLDNVQSGCDNLANALVALSEAAADTDIVSATSTLQNSTSNAVMSTLRLNYDSLMDIISIPSLFDAFVRTGAYEDALDLASFVSRLVLRYPSVATVQSISAQVSASTSLMLAQLIAILRSNAKLPLCIRVIGYLRRMEVYPETELRLVFLQQKDAYFCQVLSEIRESDPADHLKKYIEVSRENFFDIITQYKAIFADAAPTGSSTSHLSATSPTSSYSQTASSTSTTTAIFYPSTRAIATQSILSSYVAQTVSIFLETLKSTLPKLTDTQSINSLLTQTMYYGMSLGRVGCDFRVAATDMYLDAILRVFCSTVDQGLSGYFKWIENNPVANPALGLYVKVVSSAYPNSSTPPRSSVASSQQGVVNPPSQLNAYPPLAHVLNVFYSAFNGLRVSAPLALRERVRREVEDRLRSVVDSLVNIGGVLEKWADSAAAADCPNGLAQTSKAGANTTSTANAGTRYLEFCEACRIVSEVMIPSILEGLEVRLFGISAQVSTSTGATASESYSAAAADVVRRVTNPLVAPLNKFCAVARKSAATAAAKDAVAAASKDAAKLEMAKLEVDKKDASITAKQSSVEMAKEDTVGIAVQDPVVADKVDGASVAIARESTPTEQKELKAEEQAADLKQTLSMDAVAKPNSEG